MAVQASRRQKRQAKKVKEASRKRAITESNIGRVQFGRSIWGVKPNGTKTYAKAIRSAPVVASAA